jgi:hypothetical protein
MDSIQFLIQLNEEENGNEPTKLLVRHTTLPEKSVCLSVYRVSTRCFFFLSSFSVSNSISLHHHLT